MGDAEKIQAQLLQELAVLRQRLAHLEAEPAGRQAAGQEQRMQSEARLRAILETAVDGIITFDMHGHIESVNQAAELPLLFEPLHTTKAEGTGLGLYLVREIVAAHDGHLAVRSVPGEGTTCTLTLPRAAGAHR